MAVKHALIIVDVQRDFCEGGALAASDTSSLLKPLEKFIESVRQTGGLIVFTQDWHPPNHKSFRGNGGQWPTHCEAGSHGAELMPPLVAHTGDLVIHKGIASDAEGYSAFESTGLAGRLRSHGVESVGVCGIATEYCVRATALDAVRAGFKVVLVNDLVRAVDAQATTAVLRELTDAGIKSVGSHAWFSAMLERQAR
jgi:nicotinamidase/pyrazinamidase